MQILRHQIVRSEPVELSTAIFGEDTKFVVMAAGTIFSLVIGAIILYTKTTLSAELGAKFDKQDTRFDAKFESQNTSQLVLIGVIGIFCLVIGAVAVLNILSRYIIDL